MTGKTETIWLVVNFGCLKTLKFDFIPGLIYLEASVCPAAAVCPVVRMPFRAAQGCSYCNMYIHSFSDTRSFQKCSVCSFFICEQMFFSRVGRQREIYWKTTWMDFKTVVFFFPSAHLLGTCWQKSVLERSRVSSVPSSRHCCLWCFLKIPLLLHFGLPSRQLLGNG